MVNEVENYNINLLNTLCDQLWNEHFNGINQHAFFLELGLIESCDIVFHITSAIGDELLKYQKKLRELQFAEETQLKKQEYYLSRSI